MKKSLVIIFMLLFVSVMSYGQSKGKSKPSTTTKTTTTTQTQQSWIKLGFQLGANIANTEIKNTFFEFENTTHFMGGILVEFKISNIFYIQPEINYLPKGITTKPIATLYNGTAEYTFDYIEIPINVLAKFNAGVFTPFLFAGPSLSISSKANYKFHADILGYPIDESDDMSNVIEKTDFSINFGAGGEFKLSNSVDLFILARYSLGLTNIHKERDGEITTRGIAIAAGLKFSI